MNNFESICSDLIWAARRCYESGMQTGNGGNFSARVPGKEQMFVKASGMSFVEASESTIVRTDFSGTVISGQLKPSKESLLHGAIYRNNPLVNAIIHCHSPYATAWASTGQSLPFATHHAALKLKACVRVFDTESYAVPEAYFPQILSIFEDEPEAKAFLLRRHGAVAMGATVREALFNAELLEETARLAILEIIIEKQLRP